MATRAQFFVGAGSSARWVTFLWVDGSPRSMPADLLNARTAQQFQRSAVAFANKKNSRGHSTEDRQTWDESVSDAGVAYVYFFQNGRVWIKEYGQSPVAAVGRASGGQRRSGGRSSAPRVDDDAVTRVMDVRRPSWSDSIFPGGVTPTQMVLIGLGMAGAAYVIGRWLLTPSETTTTVAS
jgi:hypothetical protein